MPEAFHFMRPLWLLALVPLALLAWALARNGMGANPWRRAVDAALLPLLTSGRSGAARRGGIGLLAAGWAIAALALAGPTWQRKPEPVFQTSAARVVVLDLSTSMRATDVKPSRLERARFKVEDVLALGGEGRTGLVAYAGDAFAVAPLTRDANTVRALLKVLTPELMPVQGSRADLGLRKAEDLMRQAGVSSGEVLLIADGVDPAHAGSAIDAAARLRADGYRVSVIGAGTEQGAPVADAQGHALRDASDRIEIARLDADSLRAIARAGGGEYLPIIGSGDALRALLDASSQAHIDRAVGKVGAKAIAWVDEGPWLFLLLLPLAALAFRRNVLINDAAPRHAPDGAQQTAAPGVAARKPKQGRPTAALALLGVLVAGGLLVPPTPARASTWDNAWSRPDQQAAAALAAGDYAKAAQLATDAERRGSAEYKLGNYAAALENFSRASGPRADYNRGNALAKLGRYGDAVAAYDKALGADPNDADAKANKAAVEALLRKQQEQGQEQKQEPAQGAHPQDAKEAQAGQQQGQSGQAGQAGQHGQQDQQGKQAQAGQQGQEPGRQQASKANAGSPAGKSGTGEAERSAQGEPKRQPGENGGSGASSAAAAPSAAQDGRAQTASTAPPGSARSGAPQAGAEQGQGAANAQAGQPSAPETAPKAASKPGASFAEAAARLAAGNGAPKSDETPMAAGSASPASTQAAAGTRQHAAGAAPGAVSDARPMPTEEQLAAEQWLRRIPDDPGGLLRRKFLYQYQQRARENANAGGS